MATADVDICSVCTEDYNSRHRPSVLLPCGHDFCQSCLVRLRVSGKHKCPTCRQNWAGVDLQTQFGMKEVARVLRADQELEKSDVGKKKVEADRCEKHSMPFDFWVNAKREFYCRKCAAEEKSHVKLVLIEDAIPQVKAALTADVPAAKKLVKKYWESMDELHANLIKKRNSVREFMKAVQTLDDNFGQEIEQVATFRAEALEASAEIEKTEKKISTIKSPADLDVVSECKSILKKIDAFSSIPAMDFPKTLLSDIASSYVQERGSATSPPSRASFVIAILWGGVAGPLIEVASDLDVTQVFPLPPASIHPLRGLLPRPKLLGYPCEEISKHMHQSGAAAESLQMDFTSPTLGLPQKISHLDSLSSNPLRALRTPYRSTFASPTNVRESDSIFELYDDNNVNSKPIVIENKWQYQTPCGSWITYTTPASSFVVSKNVSDHIEKHYIKTNGQGTMIISRLRTLFLLDFQMMIELNTEKGTNVPIRRVSS